MLKLSDLLTPDEYALDLVRLAGSDAALGQSITSAKVQKTGLHLTGFLEHHHPDRLQLLGKAEISYLDKGGQEENLDRLIGAGILAFVVTSGLPAPDVLQKVCEKHDVPLLCTLHDTTVFVQRISRRLEEALSERTTVHGVLVDVFGIGILLTGKSGIGKSECALDLVLNGHRFIADDVVEIVKVPPTNLIGMASEVLQHHMEIRGLGILNMRELFGISSTRERKKIELVVQLTDWKSEQDYDRLGLDDRFHELMGVKIPMLIIPVTPGRNMTAILEVAARNQMLKYRGIYSAKEFEERLVRKISERRQSRPVTDEDIE
ncbi:MAG: HPr(Ser) kinase/phosphatase [Deltaproteobacteria bacterium]|nr:HPr(Ser) kinase/phosphatase [Deltaproteobacteria bacterium]